MTDYDPGVLDKLSDTSLLKRIDPLGMLDLVLKFPAQCREAVALSNSFTSEPTDRAEIRNIVSTGLGGSAIGGDFARVIVEDLGNVPFQVNRDYSLPHFVNKHTLVLAGSYSGNTEETLAAYQAAKSMEAQMSVVTSGGAIRKLAEENGDPFAIVPGGQPPRSATGYMFFPMLAYIQKRGLLNRDITPDINETLALLDSMPGKIGPDIPATDNPAKRLAISLFGRLPVIYGSQGYRGAVAYRWKCQFNENSKLAAFSNVLPEQNHNEILAWTLAQTQAKNWSVVFLRDPNEVKDTPRIARRVEVVKDLLGEATQIHEVWAEGESLLARMFHLIYFADYVTVYLAYLHGICPTDIAGIDHLKQELSHLK